MSYKILIIEDDARIATTVRNALTRYGYQASTITDFTRVEEAFDQLRPHLVILDINLPHMDGFQLCRSLRRRSAVPVLFLSARSTEMDQVLGVEMGGDDYLTKPFHLDVLQSKVKALLRRSYGEYAQTGDSSSVLKTGALSLDLASGEMRYAGESQSLTRNELRLLHLLMRRADQIVSRDACLEALWDDSTYADDNNLTVNMTRLRTKLDLWGLKDAIETRRGLGYQMISQRLGGVR